MSAYYSQSNGRAEAAVKTAKRILMDNTGPGGSLDTDKVAVALLQYHNTPLRDINRSPAQLAAGRQLRDGIPADKRHYGICRNWRSALKERERKMAEAHQEIIKKQGNARTLPSITTGTRVWVQNPVNNNWEKSGTVVESLANRQYTVKIDGSGRISRRNRKHLKVINEPPATSTAHSDPMTPASQQETRPRRHRRRPDRLSYGRCT